MRTLQRLRVNTPAVTHQTIDGEVVIINLESGNYYSVTSVGTEVWTLIEAARPIGDIVETLGRRYDAPAAEIEQSVLAFVEQLREDQLVVPLDGVSPGHPDSAESPSDAASRPRAPFERPTLQKYTDMQDLLLVDPIHEVDETGWPNAQPTRW